MHRTYSMRQSRAPTASQIQNPPPPTSSTKSGRFFGKASVGEYRSSIRYAIFKAGKYVVYPIPVSQPGRASDVPACQKQQRTTIGLIGAFGSRMPSTSSEAVHSNTERTYAPESHPSNPCLCSELSTLDWTERLIKFCNRTCLPQIDCRRLRPRSRQKAITIGKDGEECYAKHGACWERAHGSCCTWLLLP